MSISEVIERIRAFRRFKGWSVLKLAREAKVNESAIRKMNDPNWNPEAKTLKRLEAVVPEDFDPNDPQSVGDENGGSQNKCGQ